MARKKRILIVDDEKNFADMIKINLEDTEEYEVQTENEGRRALAAAKAFKPDLIFLDIIMPDMDGGEVLSQLRDDPYTRDTPVVFLTAIVTEGESGSLGEGISGYPFLSKPVSLAKLIDTIQNNIR